MTCLLQVELLSVTSCVYIMLKLFITNYVCAFSVEAPQLTSVVLTSFQGDMFELSLQYDQQVCMYRNLAYIGLSVCCYMYNYSLILVINEWTVILPLCNYYFGCFLIIIIAKINHHIQPLQYFLTIINCVLSLLTHFCLDCTTKCQPFCHCVSRWWSSSIVCRCVHLHWCCVSNYNTQHYN